MSRTRAGRKSWATRVRYTNMVGAAIAEIATLRFKYLNDVTDSMVIERSWNGQTEIISFGKAYGELEAWSGRAFFNNSGLGLSDALVEMFQQGSRVVTTKASYKMIG